MYSLILDLFENILKTTPTVNEEPCTLGEAVGSNFWLEMAEPALNSSPFPETVAHPLSDTEKDMREDNSLLFVLDDCSCAKQKLNFDQLKGKDQLLAQLLQSFTYLDVHLAVVTQLTAGFTFADGGEGGASVQRVFDIGHWTDASNRPVELKNLKVDVLEKLVGESEQLLEPPNVCLTKTWKDEIIGLTLRLYQQVVLVIWPKKETDRIYCQYGFDALMDRIESQSSATEPGHQKSSQLNLAEDLKLAIGFCRTQPLATWNQPEKGPELILRLLKFCNRLRNREQGLDLLQLSGIEAVFNHQFAKAIAKFVLKVTGN